MLRKGKKQGKFFVLEYKSFLETESTYPKAMHIGNTLAGNSLKRGCQHCFVEKKTYFDHLLYLRKCTTLECCWIYYHGTMVGGFNYAFYVRLSEEWNHNLLKCIQWIITYPNHATTQQKGLQVGWVQQIGHS